ncbi:MAG: Flp pilus assembly protein CpaB [Kiritimatiellales bacterium]|nr:Flp pilus assembly protein CpaB [Kiritimatiellales bacterium]
MKNKLVLIVAVLVGILAFWLSARYLEKERAKLYEGAVKIKVIVARRDLPAMSILKAEDLGMKSAYKSSIGDNVFLPEDFNKIKGKRLKYPLKRNEPVWWSHVDMPRGIEVGLAPMIAKGKRAISVSISGAPAVSGLVKPNDHVDLLGTFTFPSPTNPQQVESATLTLMQNVTVLATGMQLASQLGEDTTSQQAGYSTVTFEVSPREAEIVVFAQQTRGQLYLSLRNPDDIYYEDELPSVNFDYLEAVLKELNALRQQDIRRAKPEL